MRSLEDGSAFFVSGESLVLMPIPPILADGEGLGRYDRLLGRWCPDPASYGCGGRLGKRYLLVCQFGLQISQVATSYKGFSDQMNIYEKAFVAEIQEMWDKASNKQ